MNSIEQEIRSVLASEGLTGIAQIIPLQGDLSKRTYFRIVLDGSWQNHSEIILCVHPDPNDPVISDFKCMAAVLAENGIQASNLIQEIPGRGWLLETDVGSEDLQSFASRQLATDPGKVLEEYSKVLELAVSMHKLEPRAPASERRFDTEKLHWEMNYLVENLERLAWRLDFKYFLSFEMKMFLRSLCEKLDRSKPQVMVHRDLHSKNVFRKDGVWALIDFQDARMGVPWYDLASLVYDPYVSLDRSMRQVLIQKYLALSGFAFSENLFYMQSLQRVLKAMGTYSAVLSSRTDTAYFIALKRAISYLEEIIQYGGFPDHTFLFCNSLRRAAEEIEF